MKILIPVIVGAIIGYFTNWLAIKMLFRPHYEKRFFGIKIPFTPGLIPKERKRIAESIGKAVGRYLLSPETIIESISNQGVGKKIQAWVEEKIDNLKSCHKPLGDVLGNALGDYDNVLNIVKVNLSSFIISQLRREKFVSQLILFIKEKLEGIDLESIYNSLEEQLKIIINDLSNSSELKEGFNHLIYENIESLRQDERTLGEILPLNVRESIERYIEENKRLIGQSVKKILKEPDIQNKVKGFISKIITGNISKIFFAFINPDHIVEKIYLALERFIDSDETDENAVFVLKVILNKLMDTRISNLLPKAVETIGEKGISQFEDKIIKAVSSSKVQNLLFEFLKDNLKGKENEYRERILNVVDISIRQMLNSNELERAIYNFTDSVIKEALDKPVSSFVLKVDKDNLDRAYNIAATVFNKFLEKDFVQIVLFFDIENIIVEKLNSFKVDSLEQIILEIAERELKAITWLGGLLGGILGLLSPLLQMLY